MSKKVIIYDFDGVLVNSREVIIFYYEAVFNRFNLPPHPAVNSKIFSMTHRQLMSHYAKGNLLEEMCSYVPPYTMQEMLDATPLEAGAAEVIPILSKDYHLAICTNRGQSVNAYLEHHNLEKHFSYIITSVDVNHPKPDPEGVLKILAYFNAKPEKTLYIGDNDADYYAATGAGVRFIAFNANLFESPVITNHKSIFDHL
jgi:HAD superfamily hydrolase (TIGR01549 family)